MFNMVTHNLYLIFTNALTLMLLEIISYMLMHMHKVLAGFIIEYMTPGDSLTFPCFAISRILKYSAAYGNHFQVFLLRVIDS